MKTATRRQEPATVAISTGTPVTIHSRIQAAMSRHEGLADAKEKLVDLESRMAAKQSELDQIKAAVGNPDLAAMADRVLNGDDLENHTGLFARRDSLVQQIEAFALAVSRQRAEVQRQIRDASSIACDDLRPEFNEHAALFLSAIRNMQTSFTAMAATHQAAAGAGVTLTKEFSIVSTATIHGVLHQLKHIEAEWSAR